MSSSYQDFHIDHPYAQTTRARPGHKPRNEELVTWPPPEMGYTHLEEGRSEQYLSSSAGRRRGKSAKTHSEPIRAMKDQLSKENSLEDATSSSIAKDNPVTSQSTKNKSSNSLPDELLAEPQDEDGFYEIYLSQNFSTVDLDVSVYDDTASEAIPDFEELTDDEVFPRIVLSENNSTPGDLEAWGDEQDYGESEPPVDSASVDAPDFSQAGYDSSSDSSSCYHSSSSRRSSTSSVSDSHATSSLVQAPSSTAPTEAQSYSPSTPISREKQLLEERKEVLRQCPWFAAPGYDLDLEQLWMNLLRDRERELDVPPGELLRSAERFLRHDHLPELQGFDFVISYARRKQLLGLCTLFPKDRAGLSDPHLDGTDGEKGLCFAILASITFRQQFKRLVDLDARLVQLSMGYLEQALASYDQTNLWDTEMALGLVILGTAFAEHRALNSESEALSVLKIIIERVMSMSNIEYQRLSALKPLATDEAPYILFHVNVAAFIIDTYLEQPFRSLDVHPGDLEEFQKALSDAYQAIPPCSNISKRTSEFLFMIRTVEAFLYHNYWRETRNWIRKARSDFDAGFAELQAIASKLSITLPTPAF